MNGTNIPLDEYPRRCINQINYWKKEYEEMLAGGIKKHECSNEYASHIMESILTKVLAQTEKLEYTVPIGKVNVRIYITFLRSSLFRREKHILTSRQMKNWQH